MNRTEFTPLCLGGVQSMIPVALAPMTGVTSAVFRDMCLEFSRQGLPIELARPEVEQGKGQITHETEMITATYNVTMSTSRSTAATQAHIKAAIDATPRPDAPGKAQVEGMFVGEVITAKALQMSSARSWVVMKSGSLQAVKSIQLYGVMGEDLAWATSKLVWHGLADHIDLNFGCPVPKVTREDRGLALPRKTVYFGEVVAAVMAATCVASEDFGHSFPIPVTAKIRSGTDTKRWIFLDVARVAEDNGVAAVTLHARTTSGFMGARGFTVNLGLSRPKG